MKTKKAVVLLSGGLDSATVLYYAKKRGYECRCLMFDYGQRHKRELKAARVLAERAGCPFEALSIDLPWKGSSLIDQEYSLPLKRKNLLSKTLPSTYVPGRNTIFISFALSYAETIGAGTIFIGANAIDFSGYPDCRPGYYKAWNCLLRSLGTHVAIKVPLQNMDKAQIIRLGRRLGVPYELTWSCYAGEAEPCGVCDSCRFRAKGFLKAHCEDPALQRN